MNIVIARNQRKAELYCQKNNLLIENTHILMWIADITYLLGKGNRTNSDIIVHDLHLKLKYKISNINNIDGSGQPEFENN